tara:strand:+ start:11173 stop:11730 length:558 start_codon:yes stop_codon:yes gene_type:complete
MEKTFINRIRKLLQGRSIFLIGMMASGKSKTAPKLAELLNYKFIDVDNLVEKLTQKSINVIFEEDGENTFRDIETKCLQEIIKLPSLVVSTGGGVIIKKENWGILRQGIIVFLDINQEIALERLNLDKNKRPLLKGKNIEQEYIDIYNARREIYSQADIRIQVDKQTVEEVAIDIINAINIKIMA